jgi:hypothetical protein
MGARFRLKASFSLDGFSRNARVVLRAMQHYGLILADNGSDWFFQGTRDSRWTNALLDQLKRVPASAFEAVDESACRVSSDSRSTPPSTPIQRRAGLLRGMGVHHCDRWNRGEFRVRSGVGCIPARLATGRGSGSSSG